MVSPAIGWCPPRLGQDAPWVRLHFSDVTLSGSRTQGNEAFLRVTSLKDGAVQILYLSALPADTLVLVLW